MLLGKHFRKYYLMYLHMFIIGIAVLVLVDWLQLDIPEITGNIIDMLKRDMVDEKVIFDSIKRIGVLAAMIAAGRFVWRYTIFGASRRIEYRLRNEMFSHATKLSQSFYNQEKVGGLMTYFINDLEAVRMAYGPGILMIVDGVVMGGLAIYKMASLNVKLTIYASIPMVVLLFVMIFIRKTTSKLFKQRQQAFEDLSYFTQENFSGIQVIKAFVREMKEYMFFQKNNQILYDKHIHFTKFIVFINIFVGLALNLVILTIIIFGSLIAINSNQHDLTAGQLTEFYSYFMALTWPVMALSRFVQVQGQAKASAERLERFLDTEYDVSDSIDAIEKDYLKGTIEVKDLTFQYPDGDFPVLKGVSFKINQGEMVGILGRTGSGKSSLVDLFLRIFNIEKSQIYIDGIDIMDLKIKSVRNTIGYVPQDNFLFSEPIRSNIGFAFDDIDDDVIMESAKLADVYDNIKEFKFGFDTMLGERGVTVSGGQKQRISIARALAKNPEVLILDDSVSAVDTKTEEAIINNLHEIRKNKTTIFIAHRISTVKRMDKIILLDDGKVSAIGNHEELLKTSPLYKEMVRLQTLEQIVEGGHINERLPR